MICALYSKKLFTDYLPLNSPVTVFLQFIEIICECLELFLTQINIMASEGLEYNRCDLWTALMIHEICVIFGAWQWSL